MFKDLYTYYILSALLLFSPILSSNSYSDNNDKKSVNIDVIEQNYDYLIIKYSINHQLLSCYASIDVKILVTKL